MLKVEKIKHDKERFLPLIQISDASIEHCRTLLIECDLYILFSNQMPISEALVKKEGNICHIMSIATDEHHRGLGHAARLVNYLKDDYANDVDVLRIEVPKQHEVPFYALGFQLVEEKETNLLLQKNLKESE